jgi:branched-chain amino acid transport system substrate-binding protein
MSNIPQNLILLLTVVLLAGAPHKVQAQPPILIAAAGPVTGQLAGLGEQMLRGARMAVDDLNAAGGVLGRPVELLIADDRCDPKDAVSEANRLAARGVVFVAGHFCSSASIAAASVYDEERVLMISPASTSPRLTEEGGDLVFRVCGRDDRQGEVAGALIVRRFPGARIALLHDKSAYGRGLAEAARQMILRSGGQIVLDDSFTPGERDYQAVVTRLKTVATEVVFIGGYHPEAGLILRQMREQGLDAQLVGGDALIVEEFWQIAGPAAEGALMTFVPEPRDSPDAQQATARFRAAGIEPEGYVLYTYAAIEAWAAAVARAGSSAPDTVASELRRDVVPTVIGPLRFDEKGDVADQPFTMYRWSRGRYEALRE